MANADKEFTCLTCGDSFESQKKLEAHHLKEHGHKTPIQAVKRTGMNRSFPASRQKHNEIVHHY